MIFIPRAIGESGDEDDGFLCGHDRGAGEARSCLVYTCL